MKYTYLGFYEGDKQGSGGKTVARGVKAVDDVRQRNLPINSKPFLEMDERVFPRQSFSRFAHASPSLDQLANVCPPRPKSWRRY